MRYLLFIDADSDSMGKIAGLINGLLLRYVDVKRGLLTDGNRKLMVACRYDADTYKKPRMHIIVTYSINEYNDENKSNYKQRGVMSIETNDIDMYIDIIETIDSFIQQYKCEIEKLLPMAYVAGGYEPEKLIAKDMNSVYLRFTCRRGKGKPSE